MRHTQGMTAIARSRLVMARRTEGITWLEKT
jgi:hypothetical protein